MPGACASYHLLLMPEMQVAVTKAFPVAKSELISEFESKASAYRLARYTPERVMPVACLLHGTCHATALNALCSLS